MTQEISSTTSAEFLEKLKKALSRDGDFPASARVVSELREIISRPDSTSTQVAEIILREPSLGTRVLHLVNSSFYRRAKPIMTVSQAVIQIGMRPLAELCSGLVLLQKFIPAARQGGPFAQCLKRTIVTSLLTSSISSQMAKQSATQKTSPSSALKDEAGYLAGTFAEIGVLLLAYYFPKLYESAEKRSEQKAITLAQSIEELVGLSPLEISIEVIEELQLPEDYLLIIERSMEIAEAPGPTRASVKDGSSIMADSLYAGLTLSEAITDATGTLSIEDALATVLTKVQLDSVHFTDVLGGLGEAYKEYCDTLELQLPGLSNELSQYRPRARELGGQQRETTIHETDSEQEFLDFINEIRQAVENREPSASIITTVMETLAWSLGFDRVLLMLFGRGKQSLHGRMLLGHIPEFDPKSFSRNLLTDTTHSAAEVLAVRQSRPIFEGEPLFPDGFPFVALPVGYERRTVGVIYADRSSDKKDRELSEREEEAITTLAELLDRSIALNR